MFDRTLFFLLLLLSQTTQKKQLYKHSRSMGLMTEVTHTQIEAGPHAVCKFTKKDVSQGAVVVYG